MRFSVHYTLFGLPAGEFGSKLINPSVWIPGSVGGRTERSLHSLRPAPRRVWVQIDNPIGLYPKLCWRPHFQVSEVTEAGTPIALPVLPRHSDRAPPPTPDTVPAPRAALRLAVSNDVSQDGTSNEMADPCHEDGASANPLPCQGKCQRRHEATSGHCARDARNGLRGRS